MMKVNSLLTLLENKEDGCCCLRLRLCFFTKEKLSSSLRKEHRMALKTFLKKKDMFVVLPTGYDPIACRGNLEDNCLSRPVHGESPDPTSNLMWETSWLTNVLMLLLIKENVGRPGSPNPTHCSWKDVSSRPNLPPLRLKNMSSLSPPVSFPLCFRNLVNQRYSSFVRARFAWPKTDAVLCFST